MFALHRRKWVIFSLLSFGTSSIYADTISNAITQSINNHPQVLSAQSAEKAAQQDVKQQKAGYLPKADVFLGYGEEYTDNPATRFSPEDDNQLFRQESNFVASQLLYDGGNVSSQVARAKANATQSSDQLASVQEALAYDAASAFLAVRRDREQLRVYELSVEAHQEIYTKIKHRYQSGVGTKADVTLASSRLALARANLNEQENHLKDDEATYEKVVGSPAPKSLSLPKTEDPLPGSLTQAQQLALSLNPNLAASKDEIAARGADVGVARSSYFPTFKLDANASFNDSLDGVAGYNNDRAALVHMNYNVYRGGGDKAAVDAAKYRLSAASEDNQSLIRDTKESVALAWNSLDTAKKRIPQLQLHSTESYNVWQSYIKLFKLGQSTLFDLLNAQSEYYQAKINLLEAQYDKRMQSYRLLASIGNLVAVSTQSSKATNSTPSKPKMA